MPEQDARGDSAEWYGEHREELLQWAEDPPPAEAVTARRRRGAMVSARFSREEVAALRAAAEGRGVSLSELVRDAALRIASGPATDERRPATPEDIRRIVREELAAERRTARSPSLTESSIIELSTRRPA
jgi:uncharacterized protein (DUF1778 family)